MKKSLRTKYSETDFSKHQVFYSTSKDLNIFYLKKEKTIIDSVKFINTNGILAVTGDYGNWIFCREFHPTADGYVSSQYWAEKLGIYSTQNPYEFDSDGTSERIKEHLEDVDKDLSLEEIDYLNEILSEVDDEINYTYVAYRNYVGRYSDGEYVPFVKKYKYWFLAVMDAFNEICQRMEDDRNDEFILLGSVD